MTEDGVRWITDVREKWNTFRVDLEGGVFDASQVAPGVRALGLTSVTVSDGELAKVEGLESLAINGGSAERVDLRG